jgi:hypothetical protein
MHLNFGELKCTGYQRSPPLNRSGLPGWFFFGREYSDNLANNKLEFRGMKFLVVVNFTTKVTKENTQQSSQRLFVGFVKKT